MFRSSNNPLTDLITPLLVSAAVSRRNMTPEQKQERELLRLAAEQREKEEIYKLKIIRNECPSCGGNLKRGKKSKQHDYKRAWSCTNCGEVHYV